MADTALTIVTEALREIRVIARDETLEDDIANQVLAKANDMLDSWSLENIMCFAQQEESFPLTIGTGAYTIGSGGDFDTERPKAIDQAWVRDANGQDSELRVWGSARWGRIPNKSISGWPNVLYYVPNYPLGTIRIADTPAQAFRLHIVSDKPLTRFAALSTSYSFPPGYKRAIVSNLAVDRASSFGKKPSDELKEIALSSKDVIRRLNLPEVVASYDDELHQSKTGFDIYAGGPA